MTLARMMRLQRLEDVPALASKGLREMRDADLPQVATLFMRYMERFDMLPLYSLEEMRHNFLSGLGKRGSDAEEKKRGWKVRRQDQVVWSYVVEDSSSGKITDFFTFYSLPSTCVQSTKYDAIEAAYLFYYASEVAMQPGADEDGRLKSRLIELIGDAIIVAKGAGFDVFNALTLMDNPQFLEGLKVC